MEGSGEDTLLTGARPHAQSWLSCGLVPCGTAGGDGVTCGHTDSSHAQMWPREPVWAAPAAITEPGTKGLLGKRTGRPEGGSLDAGGHHVLGAQGPPGRTPGQASSCVWGDLVPHSWDLSLGSSPWEQTLCCAICWKVARTTQGSDGQAAG